MNLGICAGCVFNASFPAALIVIDQDCFSSKMPLRVGTRTYFGDVAPDGRMHTSQLHVSGQPIEFIDVMTAIHESEITHRIQINAATVRPFQTVLYHGSALCVYCMQTEYARLLTLRRY